MSNDTDQKVEKCGENVFHTTCEHLYSLCLCNCKERTGQSHQSRTYKTGGNFTNITFLSHTATVTPFT